MKSCRLPKKALLKPSSYINPYSLSNFDSLSPPFTSPLSALPILFPSSLPLPSPVHSLSGFLNCAPDVCWFQQETSVFCKGCIPFHEPRKVVVCRKDLVSALDLTAVEDFSGGGVGGSGVFAHSSFKFIATINFTLVFTQLALLGLVHFI